ncbi:hypothetical protein SAMN05216532_5229 [Streptomyces sp. 2231.1]|uniref:hypothetical protein n=1 Tax=Streptomyces sp. 2231.1 TaxID=1855347 RepID=UPI000897CDA3|nr:hypothetical protein [Streptomyces sp. 2231.1]SED65283.1 hypothetical protein SAMN05216532_5229 [Streptomyces sp. 2231.1]
MTPIRALSRAAQESEPGAPGTDAESGARRGRHRKPRPRKVLLAAGGLALAAGVLSLVRVAPESGVGVPGTAEAEPRPDHGGGATEGAARTAAAVAVAADPTALPSATSAMGGRSLTPADSGTPTAVASATAAAPHGETAAPTAVPTGAPPAPGGTPRPSATTSAPRPAPTTPTPTPTPTPSRSTADPDPGGLCLPVISLCVDVLDRNQGND